MKKLIVFLLFGLFITTFSSCSKDDNIERNNNDKPLTGIIGLTPNGSSDLAKFDSTSSNLRAPDMRILYCEWGWVWEGGELHWGIIWCHCFNITHNCLPTVTITRNLSAYNNFKSHFDNGSLQKYFSSDDYKSIFPELEDLGVIDKLQNGKMTLYLNHDTLMNKDFYIGLPQGTEFSRTDTSWMSKTECVLVIDNDL